MRMRSVVISMFIAFAAACSGGGKGGTPVDAPPMVDMFFSKCGMPGDTGNELGIGKFCASQGDCGTTTDAPLCSSLGDKDTHFCTKTCPMGSTDQCGTAANCVCNGGG